MANKSESNKVIGEIIKKARMEKGLSLRELARKSGVSQPYLSQLESGQNNNPTLEVFIKLADALGITLKEMLIEAELIESDEKTEKENKVFKVNVDVSDALKGLKAITREAKRAGRALRELEQRIKEFTQYEENCPNCGGDYIEKTTTRTFDQEVVEIINQCLSCGMVTNEVENNE